MGRWALEDGGGEGGLRRALEQNANAKEGALDGWRACLQNMLFSVSMIETFMSTPYNICLLSTTRTTST